MPERLVPLGEIVATHGIEGWLKLKPHNPASPTLLSTREIFLEKDGVQTPLVLKSIKPHKNLLLVLIEGIDGINQAEKWIGAMLSIDEAGLPPLGANEYYYYQVVGLDVYDTKGTHLGKIARIWPTAGGDLYVVQGEGKEYLIPVVKEIIEKIDFDAGRVIVDPPEGLLEL
ncbi:MAG TPA: ribosome maturation factor RimM [Candidatus Binatia bacterium]